MRNEPEPSRWTFPSVVDGEPDGPVAIGGDLEPGTLLAAYRAAMFPMPIGRRGRIGWWSPDPRAVLPLDRLRISRSLSRSLRRYDVTIDAAFESVIRSCADPKRPHGWITRDLIDAYTRLADLGWAHSVECWDDGELVGGLYGVSIGGFFAGESMFHRATDASKVALVRLVEVFAEIDGALIDVQWQTPHLESLGVVEIPRVDYVGLLAEAVEAPIPPDFR
ncbi:MAG: leucyl/phenylalanyl-tRNA--protein transferase [Acidimicrobiales bacterium]